jgi:hypothetical protein
MASGRSEEERKEGFKRTGLDWDFINPILILTKREHGKINSSPHPQSRRANDPSEGGGRLQFCLLHWMPWAREGYQNLLFFTFLLE